MVHSRAALFRESANDIILSSFWPSRSRKREGKNKILFFYVHNETYLPPPDCFVSFWKTNEPKHCVGAPFFSLKRPNSARDGNRTRVSSLGSLHSTIELPSHFSPLVFSPTIAFSIFFVRQIARQTAKCLTPIARKAGIFSSVMPPMAKTGNRRSHGQSFLTNPGSLGCARAS